MWVRSNKGNVFVGNLPPDFPDERLAEAFDSFGIVLSAIVARDPTTGARLRYGFVDIATDRAAAKAISALDGSEIDGCKLNVKPRDRTAKKAGGAPPRRPPRGAARQNGQQNGQVHQLAAAPQRWHSQHQPEARAESAQQPALRQLAQSQAAREALPEVEPPPRRDFEVVRRPIRRTTPTFQVERRSLPRRV